MAHQVFRYQRARMVPGQASNFVFDGPVSEVPLLFDWEAGTMQVVWRGNKVATVILGSREHSVTHIKGHAASGASLGPGGDMVDISPEGNMTYYAMGCGVPYTDVFHGHLVPWPPLPSSSVQHPSSQPSSPSIRSAR